MNIKTSILILKKRKYAFIENVVLGDPLIPLDSCQASQVFAGGCRPEEEDGGGSCCGLRGKLAASRLFAIFMVAWKSLSTACAAEDELCQERSPES